MVNIKSTVPDFLKYWEKAKECCMDEKVRLWNDYYIKQNEAIFNVYYDGGYAMKEYLKHNIRNLSETIPKIQELNYKAEEIVRYSVKECFSIFKVPEEELDFVIMVGQGSSDGWVTNFKGKHTSFIALEFISDIEQLGITIAHETAHLIHIILRDLKENTVIANLFKEGIAIYVSSLIFSSSDQT